MSQVIQKEGLVLCCEDSIQDLKQAIESSDFFVATKSLSLELTFNNRPSDLIIHSFRSSSFSWQSYLEAALVLQFNFQERSSVTSLPLFSNCEELLKNGSTRDGRGSCDALCYHAGNRPQAPNDCTTRSAALFILIRFDGCVYRFVYSTHFQMLLLPAVISHSHIHVSQASSPTPLTRSAQRETWSQRLNRDNIHWDEWFPVSQHSILHVLTDCFALASGAIQVQLFMSLCIPPSRLSYQKL